MTAVRLEVIAPTLQGMGFCSPCELMLSEAELGGDPATRGMDEYPQEWQEHFRKLTTWVYDVAERYGEGVLVKVIDPQSPEGLIKSVRYRIRRYPTWIVDGKVCAVGWDRPALEDALHRSQERD